MRVVLVTGGTRGIGRGIAEAFLEEGDDVFVCARRSPDAPIAAGGREAHFVAADLREEAGLDAVIAALPGRLDVLVNNAGGSPPADAATASPRFSRAILALNLLAPLDLSQRAHAIMRTQPGGGVILNIASISGTRASPGTAAYGAAKAGLLNLTRSLAVEWAPKVRVNAVTAGPIHTDLSNLHYDVAAMGARIPLGRLGLPRDVANACLFLASPRAAWITGADLVVDGGGVLPGGNA